jgi:hypothetical protein
MANKQAITTAISNARSFAPVMATNQRVAPSRQGDRLRLPHIEPPEPLEIVATTMQIQIPPPDHHSPTSPQILLHRAPRVVLVSILTMLFRCVLSPCENVLPGGLRPITILPWPSGLLSIHRKTRPMYFVPAGIGSPQAAARLHLTNYGSYPCWPR